MVQSGEYIVLLKQAGYEPVAHYYKGDCFGELALMYSCARAATVSCVVAGVLWGLDRMSYRKVMQQTHDSATNTLAAMLRTCEPLKPLDPQQVRDATRVTSPPHMTDQLPRVGPPRRAPTSGRVA